MRQIVGLLGTPIDILNTQEALERLEQFIDQRRFHQVATANTDFLINALDDKELRNILREADLVVPDGMPLIWAARLMRSPLPERVTGADLVPAIAEMAAQKGYRIFMLGAKPEVAERAQTRLEENYPGIKIVGRLSPEPRPLLEMNNETILSAIAAAEPDILFVAFGNPKQEKWIHMHRDRLKAVPICIGIGGTFDFIAGQTVRAPVWIQKSGFEWAFRLLQEPKRLWRRYYRDITQFSRYLLSQWRAVSWGAAGPAGEVFHASAGDSVIISVIGALNAESLPRFREVAEQAIDRRKHLLLDFQHVTGFDGEALGALLNLPKRAAFRDCDVRLIAASQKILRALTKSIMEDGSYQRTECIAQGFSNVKTAGLEVQVASHEAWAIISVSGASERRAVLDLAEKCRRLLLSHEGLELDLRAVSFADTNLLAMLADVAREAPGRVRVVEGPGLAERLRREPLTASLPIVPPSLDREALTRREAEVRVPVAAPGGRR